MTRHIKVSFVGTNTNLELTAYQNALICIANQPGFVEIRMRSPGSSAEQHYFHCEDRWITARAFQFKKAFRDAKTIRFLFSDGTSKRVRFDTRHPATYSFYNFV